MVARAGAKQNPSRKQGGAPPAAAPTRVPRGAPPPVVSCLTKDEALSAERTGAFACRPLAEGGVWAVYGPSPAALRGLLGGRLANEHVADCGEGVYAATVRRRDLLALARELGDRWRGPLPEAPKGVPAADLGEEMA